MEIIVGIIVVLVLFLLYTSNTPKSVQKEAAVQTEQTPPVVTEVVAPVKKTRAKPATKAPVKAKPVAKAAAKPAAKKTTKKTK